MNFLTYFICATIPFLFITKASAEESQSSVLIFGIDGCDRTDLDLLLKKGKLPTLQALINEGSRINTTVSFDRTETKPGWSQILSGYDSTVTKIESNKNYQPIPKGLTIFERLKDHTKKNIRTFFLTGKDNNTGARGPHEICTNCITRNSDDRMKTSWWTNPEQAPTKNSEKRIIEKRSGEPFFNALDSIDVYKSSLNEGENVRLEAIAQIQKIKNQSFIGFVHFEEPDEQGHVFGEGSKEYLNAISEVDKNIGLILQELRKLNLDKTVSIFVTTDHGFDLKKKGHSKAPNTWLISNLKNLRNDGDRKDLTPTILEMMKIDLDSLQPPLQGKSLLKKDLTEVKIGYFNGGRTALIYRAYIHQNFEKYGIDLHLITKSLRKEEFYKAPTKIELFNNKKLGWGKASGIELLSLIDSGQAVGATIGETAFLAAVSQNLPIVAVAELGHDTKAMPGHAFVVRKGVDLTDKKNFKGLRFGARRSAGGDEIMLREFLVQNGVDPDKDVTIVKNIDDDLMGKMLEEKKLDAAYAHLMAIRKWTKNKYKIEIFRKLDWVNPETSQSLLVFSREFLEKNRDLVQKIVKGYVDRIRDEEALPEHHRKKRNIRGLEIETDFKGMNFPKFESTPVVREDVLNEWKNLLLKHKHFPKDFTITGSIDNSFVKMATSKDLKPK